PAVPEVDRGVVDLRRAGARAARAEEEDVGRREPLGWDASSLCDLAAHLHRRAAVDHLTETGSARVALELVDAPDEARAVRPAARLDSERRLRAFARPAPDVRVADEGDRLAQDRRLPRGQRGEAEGARRRTDAVDLVVAEPEDPSGGERGLGPRRG